MNHLESYKARRKTKICLLTWFIISTIIQISLSVLFIYYLMNLEFNTINFIGSIIGIFSAIMGLTIGGINIISLIKEIIQINKEIKELSKK